ncbi:hypothetical protein RA27_14720 [Ruegeria sp. ANG-R]|nr:hypothetical protein RA27_14720 [Ruegeria sp. ANG-R]
MRSVEIPAHRALMAAVGNADLTPFETDGCSGGLSSSWRLVAQTFPDFSLLYEAHPPWEYCCVTHDRAYHDAGGASQADASFDARLAADDKLRACVKAHGETHAVEYAKRYDMTPDQIISVHSITSEAMYMAVRFGGGPCSGLPWRWGFGYPGCSVFAAPARE